MPLSRPRRLRAVQMIKAMMMTAATAASTHGVASVRVCSWGSDSPVPGFAGPLPAGFGVLGAPEEGAGLVGVCVEGPDGLVESGVGVGVVAATLPWAALIWAVFIWAVPAWAALAATVVDSMDPAQRANAAAVVASLRNIVTSKGLGRGHESSY